MKIIRYEQSPEVGSGQHSIFLAGPTPRSPEVASWRGEAIRILEDIGYDGCVFLPESENGPCPDYTFMVDWEKKGLSVANAIVFWVPRDLETLPGFTTNVEFGRYVASGRAFYGRPDGAPNTRYLDWMYFDVTGHLHYSELEGLLEAATLANRRVRDGLVLPDGTKTWVVSDWHLGEDNLKIMQRPFSSSADNDINIINNHNQVVGDDDLVIVVGDVVSRRAINPSERLADVGRMAGQKILIRGNHDRIFTEDELLQYFCGVIPEGHGLTTTFDGIEMYFTHYPTRARADRFNLVGHIHGAWKYQLNMLNVGVDAHHYRPIPLEQISFYLTAIKEFYDDDVWCASHPANANHIGSRGKRGSYFTDK